MIQPPDFIGIGAQKSGTTWWHHLLLKHPDVYDGSHLHGRVTPHFLTKERHFFLVSLIASFQKTMPLIMPRGRQDPER